MTARLPLEERARHFLLRARQAHGHQYDYSKVEYLGADIKVQIVCAVHGPFWQLAASHVRGSGCAQCGRLSQSRKTKGRPKESQIASQHVFLAKARAAHGDSYNYSESVYQGFGVPVTILCPKHGPFNQAPVDHVRGKGCAACGHERRVAPLRYNKGYFIQRSTQVHGSKYDYSLVSEVRRGAQVVILCPRHGSWEQAFEKHLEGTGCPRCGDESAAFLRSEEARVNFVPRARQIHGDRYDYSAVEYVNARTPVAVKCFDHGFFMVRPSNHLSLRTGCPRCARGNVSAMSDEWLDSLGISIRERTLEGLPYRVDGLDATERVVYEFLGCFWHGCPSCHDSTEENPVNRKTYGELHKYTVDRRTRMIEAGFSVVEMWEHDYPDGKPVVHAPGSESV